MVENENLGRIKGIEEKMVVEMKNMEVRLDEKFEILHL
jgi:hypothetical protein